MGSVQGEVPKPYYDPDTLKSDRARIPEILSKQKLNILESRAAVVLELHGINPGS